MKRFLLADILYRLVGCATIVMISMLGAGHVSLASDFENANPLKATNSADQQNLAGPSNDDQIIGPNKLAAANVKMANSSTARVGDAASVYDLANAMTHCTKEIRTVMHHGRLKNRQIFAIERTNSKPGHTTFYLSFGEQNQWTKKWDTSHVLYIATYTIAQHRSYDCTLQTVPKTNP